MRFLVDVGLDYLTLDRMAATLSGGEAQRIRLATQIGSQLMGVLYILDEPSIGLHQRDNARLIRTLLDLRDLGNTVLVIEHDEETMRSADWIVDMGPGAGEHGGYVVCSAPTDDFMHCSDSLTAQYLRGEKQIDIPAERRPGNGDYLIVRDASENNLKHVDVRFPLGKLICVTGVSGSGKSSLVNEVLYKALNQRMYRAKDRPGKHGGIEGIENLDKVIDIDQSPIGRTPRSNPATYTNLFTDIRDLFAALPEAKMRGYKAGPLQLQRQGRPLRGVPGRRHHPHRDAVPARRVRAVRGVSRPALQPRGAGDQVQGQEHRRRAGDDGGRGAGVLPAHPRHPHQADHAARGRPGLRQARPAGHHPLRRRGAARQAQQGAEPPRHRQNLLHPGRADHRPALRRRPSSC